MNKRFVLLVFSFLFISTLTSVAQDGRIIEVSSVPQFVKALEVIKPGDIIQVMPGEYDLQKRIEITTKGTDKSNVTICAKQAGTVKLIGNSWFTLRNASFVNISGFEFKSNDGPAVEILGSNNVRVTNNVFHLKESVRSSWILISEELGVVKNRSHHNRIDHNLFEDKKVLGNFITVEGTMEPEFQVSQFDRIDNNYFRNIGPRVENVLEAIRVGSSYVSLSSGFTVIEKNLFEKCDGDPEIVSIKSSDDTVRYNTFRECLGVLSLRHGNRSTIDGNYFLGNGRTGEFLDSTGKKWKLGTGGVRFYGDNMKIINNYFEGLTGQKWDASLAMTSGNTEYGLGQPLTKHYRSRYTIVAFNTFVNNVSNIEVGYDGDGFQGNWWKMPPVEITVANNIVVGDNGDLIKVFQEPINSTWLGNIVFPKNNKAYSRSFSKNEVLVLDPNLIKVEGIWKLKKNSSLKGRALGSFPFVGNDIDGQQRSKVSYPGCDEISNAAVLNKPLTKEDVGPTWYK